MTQEDLSLIVGGDGHLGRLIKDWLSAQGEPFLETTRRQQTSSSPRLYLDLGKDIDSWEIPRDVSVVYLCAAITSTETCAGDPVKSRIVNVDNTVNLIQKCIDNDIFVVYPSTNGVFDGETHFQEAEAPRAPRTQYGRQKAETEEKIVSLGNNVAIIRFSKILTPDMALINSWFDALLCNKPISPFSDLVMAPVPHFLAAEISCRVGLNRVSGICQVSGPSDISYDTAAFHIAARMGIERDLVKPITTRDSGICLEHVPRYTTLDSSRVTALFGIKVPDPITTIDRVFRARFADSGRMRTMGMNK